MRRTSSAPVLIAALVLVAPIVAEAYVPEAERVERAVVDANRAARRDEPIRVELELRVENGPVVGTGEIVSHPNGLARLELRGRNGLIERHLLLGADHLASRNGEVLAEPRRFLPPLFLLQIDSRTALRAALDGLGADPDSIGLAPCGERDCFVIGDPRRIVPPPPEPEPVVDPADADQAHDGSGGLGAVADLSEEPLPEAPIVLREHYATLWVEIEGYEIVGIHGVDGVKVRFGPTAVYEQIRIPTWIEIEEPDRGIMRFDVRAVSAVNAPAAAFGRSWVTSPPPASQPAGPPAGAPAATSLPQEEKP